MSRVRVCSRCGHDADDHGDPADLCSCCAAYGLAPGDRVLPSEDGTVVIPVSGVYRVSWSPRPN